MGFGPKTYEANMTNRIVPEIRYDLTNGIEHLDIDSTIQLINLTDCWAARARLRQRWIDRHEPFLLAPYAELDQWPALIAPC